MQALKAKSHIGVMVLPPSKKGRQRTRPATLAQVHGEAFEEEQFPPDVIDAHLGIFPSRNKHCCMRLRDESVPRWTPTRSAAKSQSAMLSDSLSENNLAWTGPSPPGGSFPATPLVLSTPSRPSSRQRRGAATPPSAASRPGAVLSLTRGATPSSSSLARPGTSSSSCLSRAAGGASGSRPPTSNGAPMLPSVSGKLSSSQGSRRRKKNQAENVDLDSNYVSVAPPASVAGDFDHDGAILAEVLVSCGVVLLKVDYLRRLANKKKRLPRCQDVPVDPPESQELRSRCAVMGEELRRQVLNIADVWIVSYPWLTVEHPDPIGSRLEELVEELEMVRAQDGDLVFIDYCSLPQPDYGGTGTRTEAEEKRFQAALRQMDVIFSSQSSKVLVLPVVHNLEHVDESTISAPNVRPYTRRGWCAFEFSVASNFGRIVNKIPKELAKFDPLELQEMVGKGAITFGCTADGQAVLSTYRRPYFLIKRNILMQHVAAGEAAQYRESIGLVLRAFSKKIRAEFVKALADAKCGAFNDEIERMLGDTDFMVRLQACRCISFTEPVSSERMQKVVDLLDDEHRQVRAEVCEIVGNMGKEGEQHRDRVATHLKDDAWDVREAAMQSLSKMEHALEMYSDGVADCLDDQQAMARATALDCLLKMGQTGASYAERVARLARNEKFEFVKYAAQVTLCKMGRQDLVDAL